MYENKNITASVVAFVFKHEKHILKSSYSTFLNDKVVSQTEFKIHKHHEHSV